MTKKSFGAVPLCVYAWLASFQPIRLGVVCLVLVLCCNASAWAQISSSTGAIQGTITDPQNAAIAGASVTLTNVDTGVKVAEAATQSDGVYIFPLLPPR